ncbi:hypothetical protein VTN31DRAFT_7260 [Thermomyces dupontii]|uniref:uncharacterized protein n=1 Tax=Talaromyces thermophilus TaxID=28565 RepID=UPI0037430002
MSESPRSEKSMTRFSTPVPELDDHRFQMDPHDPTPDAGSGATAGQRHIDQPDQAGEPVTRPVLGQIQDGYCEDGPISRDFQQAVIDDEDDNRSVRDIDDFARRLSIDPSHRHRRFSRNQQDGEPHSRASSTSGSSSPPNSVDAFADPRRRERANTMGSHTDHDFETILQRTVSGGSRVRRPTFSNGSAIRLEQGDGKIEVAESARDHSYREPGRIPVIDYEELEEFVATHRKSRQARRKHSMSSQSHNLRVFHDLRPKSHQAKDVPTIVIPDASPERSSSDGFKDGHVEKVEGKFDEKNSLDDMPNANERTRFSFFSSESQSTIHACELGDLCLPGDTFRDLFQLGPDGGVWWLDVLDPTEEELGAIARAFSIHPLTAEDIMTQEVREKVELFKQYYFVCFRTFYQMDKNSERFLDPINLYMVVYRDGVLSFSFTENPHAANVRKRIGKLRDYVALSSDWICYAMIDDIVDSFGPVIRDVEIETEAIEDHVFVARAEDFESFLPRIGHLRRKVMSLMRLLGGKADVIRGFSKRCNEQYSVTPRGDIRLYLGDIQDHVVTMMSNLTHFEKMLSRSHSNYLAQLSVTNISLGNHINRILSKVTLLASLLVPLNLICGLWGMNVPVPGQDSEGLGWFFGIVGIICFVVIISTILARYFRLF